MFHNKSLVVKKKKKSPFIRLMSRFLLRTVHLLPFFLGFIVSRFYQLSFPNDIFLIGMLITAILLFTVRKNMPEPPYKD